MTFYQTSLEIRLKKLVIEEVFWKTPLDNVPALEEAYANLFHDILDGRENIYEQDDDGELKYGIVEQYDSSDIKEVLNNIYNIMETGAQVAENLLLTPQYEK